MRSRRTKFEQLETRSMLSATVVEYNDVGYVFNQAAPRVERYDIAAETWQAPVTLTDTTAIPTVGHVDADGIYAAFGKEVYRYNTDGTGKTHLLNTEYDVRALQSDGNVLFVNQSGVRFSTINKTTRAVIAKFDMGHDSIHGSSIAPAINRIFGRTSGLYPSDLTFAQYRDDGTFVTSGSGPYHGDYPGASTTWVFPGDAKVVDDSGTVYDTATLKWYKSLGTRITDLDFAADGRAIVLSGNKLTSYDAALLPAASATIAYSPDEIFVNDRSIITFTADAGSPTGYSAEAIPLATLRPAAPGQAVNPFGLAYTPDTVQPTADGTVLLFSKSQSSIFRWNADSQSYAKTIPLIGAANYMAYSAVTDTAYLAYPSGLITKIGVGTANATEVPITTLPEPPRGLAMAGDYVFAVDSSGAWVSHHTFTSDGTRIESVDWNYYSRQYVWSDANQLMYYLRDDTSPNDLIAEPINANGVAYPSEPAGGIGSKFDSPLHGDYGFTHPIRVSPDGSVVLLGSGAMHDGKTLARLSTALPHAIRDAAWLDGQLYTVRTVNGATELQQWSGSSYAPAKTATLPGAAQSLVALPNGRLLAVSLNSAGVPTFNVLNADLGVVEPPAYEGNSFSFSTDGVTHILTVDGAEHRLDAAVSSVIRVKGTGTSDEITVNGTSGNETATLSEGSATITGPMYSVTIQGVEKIVVDAGAGTSQTATISDSPGDDAFRLDTATGAATMTYASGSSVSLGGFQRVDARSNPRTGETDSATLLGTDAAETLNSYFYGDTAKTTTFERSGTVYTGLQGFETLTVEGRGGGDSAQLFDGPATDFLTLSAANSANVTGSLVYGTAAGSARVVVSGFDTIAGKTSGVGGPVDQAVFYDAPGNDLFQASNGISTLSPAGNTAYKLEASGFDKVYVFANAGGTDEAQFNASNGGTDTLSAYPDNQLMRYANGAAVRALGFDKMSASSTDIGTDYAYLFDSAGNDVLSYNAAARSLRMYNGSAGTGLSYDNNLSGVGWKRIDVRPHATTSGGSDAAEITGTAGADRFYARPSGSELPTAFMVDNRNGTGQPNYIVLSMQGIETVAANSGGGADTAYVYGSAGDDTLDISSLGSTSSITAKVAAAGSLRSLKGFSTMYAYGEGGNDTANWADSSGNDKFQAYPHLGLAYMSYADGAANYVANGFGRVSASAMAGGTDEALFLDTAGDDAFSAGPEAASMLPARGNPQNYSALASGFDRYYGYSFQGGNDAAELYDSLGSDYVVARNATVEMNYGAGQPVQWARATLFKNVTAYSTTDAGGDDSATFFDTAGNETLTIDPNGATFVRATGNPAGFYNYKALGFEYLTATSNASTTDEDVLIVTDSAANDRVRAWGAAATVGGANRLLVEYGRLDAAPVTNRVADIRGFNQPLFSGRQGGNDEITFFDVATADDTFSGETHSAEITATAARYFFRFADLGAGDKLTLSNSTGGLDTVKRLATLDYLLAQGAGWTE